MNIISKALVGTVAAGAVAMTSASPAMARDRYDRGGISAGDIIAGALVIGGIAAVASAANRDRGYGYNGTYGGPYNGGYYDRGYNGGGYYNGGYGYNDPRQAVEACVRAAEANASRYSYGRAKVTDIRDIDRTSYGLKVQGRIAVNQLGRGWRNGDPRYGSGWGNDYRGWNDNYRGYDAGKFTCKVSNGRVYDLDYSGIRGL